MLCSFLHGDKLWFILYKDLSIVKELSLCGCLGLLENKELPPKFIKIEKNVVKPI